MRYMHFMPKLTEFLRKNKVIYTIREYKYSSDETIVPSIGKVKRTFIMELPNFQTFNPKELWDEYVKLSGFSNAEDWVKTAASFIKGKDVSMFLYHVKIVEGE